MKTSILSEIPVDSSPKTPILFVHGAWHGPWCWQEYFLPFFAQHGYPAIAIDLQGSGSGDTRKRLNSLRISDYVSEVVQAADSLPTPPVLIGHSMGGLVVQKYLEQHSAPCAVLLASLPVNGLFRSLLRTAGNHPKLFIQSVLTRDMHPFVGSTELVRESFFSKEIDPEKLVRYRYLLRNESFRAFLDMLLLNLPRPERIHTPLLVLGAGNDNVFSPKEAEMTAKAYHAPFMVMENMAHDMMLEKDWRIVADHILDFLRENGI